jgi:hypothetical protein
MIKSVDWLTQFELKHGDRTRGHGVNDPRTVNPHLPLRVEADKLLQTRCRLAEALEHGPILPRPSS